MATLSPSISSIEESISTLNYAQSANCIVNKPVATSYLNVGSSVGGSASEGSAPNQSLQHWHEMECRLQYMQAQVEEAQGALARKHMQQQELVLRAETAEKKSEDLEEKLESTTLALSKTKFVLKSTSNTEHALSESVRTHLSTLKASISDGNSLHASLTSNTELMKAYKSEAKTFKASSQKSLEAIKKELSALNDCIKTTQKDAVDLSKEKSASMNENLSKISGLVDKVTSLADNYKDVVSKQMEENVKVVSASIETSSNEKLNNLVETFEKGESLLEGEVTQSSKRIEKKLEQLDSEVEPTLSEKFEAATKGTTDSLAEISSQIDAMSAALTEIEAASASKKAEIDNLLTSAIEDLKGSANSGISELSSDCDGIVGTIASARESFKSNSKNEEMTSHNCSAESRLGDFSKTVQETIAQQQELIAAQKTEIEGFKAWQAKAQTDLASAIMEGLGKLVEEQSSKVVEEANKKLDEQREGNSKLGEVLGENEKNVSSFVECSKSGLGEMSDLIAGAKENESFAEKTFGEVEGSVSGVKERMEKLGEDLVTKFEGVEGHISTAKSVDAELKSGVDASVKAAGDLSSNVKTEALASALDRVKNLNEAGSEAVAYARSNLGDFSSDLVAIRDPRETVKEEVIEGAKEVRGELASGVSSLNDCADTVKTQTEEFGERATEAFGEVKSAVESHRAILQSYESEVEKNKEEVLERTTAHFTKESEQLEEAEKLNSHYVDDVVRCEEEVPEVKDRMFYEVDEFVYETAGSEDIEKAFDSENKENNSEGIQPIKVPVSVGIAALMSIEEKVSVREKEKELQRRKEKEECLAKTGMDKPALRRSSHGSAKQQDSVDAAKGKESQPVLAEVSNCQSPARKNSKAQSHRRTLSSVGAQNKEKRSRSPRPSTAGGKQRPSTTRARSRKTTAFSKDC